MKNQETGLGFDQARARVALVLGPLLFLALLLAPLPLPLQAHRLAAVMALVVVFWIGEPIPLPITALLGPALALLLGAVPGQDPKAMAAAAYGKLGDPILLLFVGGFFIAQAMTVHGLDRRIALGILSRRTFGASPRRMVIGLGLVAFVLSMWISNTATTAMLIPIGLGMLQVARREQAPGKLGAAAMLMIAFASSVGGLGTPVGTPPNLVGIAQLATLAHVKIGFLTWMALATPIGILMMVGLSAILLRGLPPIAVDLTAYAERERQSLGPWNRGEIVTGSVFLLVVCFWILPGLAQAVGAHALSGWLEAHLPEGPAALVAASLLFLVPASPGRPTLRWEEAKQIDWGTLLLLGGGLCLGDLLRSTKLAEAVGVALASASGASSLWGITALAALLAIVVTEFISNSAAATMIVPVVIGIAQGAHVSPIPPAIAATLGCSLAFMLPVSTPPNALAYGTKLVPMTYMVSRGILFDALGFLIILIGLRLLCPLLGLL